MNNLVATLTALPPGVEKFAKESTINNFLYNMIAGTIFSAVGIGAFGYGKKLQLWQPRVIGAGLMLVPWVIYDLWILCAVCSGLLVLLWFYHDE